MTVLDIRHSAHYLS